MNRRSWMTGAAWGVCAGLVIAGAMTFLDWRANPSGLFHDAKGTNWLVVLETALSWFWPAALVVFAVTLAVHAWLSRSPRNTG